jgi:hypothetical protein
VAEALVWLVALAVVVIALRGLRGRRTHVGPASAGTIYDWLNEDKRKAIEIVVDGQAERQEGEHADGNLPDLEDPTGASRRAGPDAK